MIEVPPDSNFVIELGLYLIVLSLAPPSNNLLNNLDCETFGLAVGFYLEGLFDSTEPSITNLFAQNVLGSNHLTFIVGLGSRLLTAVEHGQKGARRGLAA